MLSIFLYNLYVKRKATLPKSFSYKTSIIRFNFFMKIKKMRYKILIAILLGIINSLVLTLFIKNTTLYSGGTSAFFLGVGRFTRTYLNIHGGATPEQINIIYNLIY
jgi:hypothetical protein